MFHVAGHAPLELDIMRPIKIFTAGNHHPVLCEMDDDAGPAGNWVVKPFNIVSRAYDRRAFAILAELAGAEVCALVGLHPPAIGVARFPSQVGDEWRSLSHLSQADATELLTLAEINAGKLAFCCKEIEGAPNLVPDHFTSMGSGSERMIQALVLLLVDTFLIHDDRRVGNPNALWSSISGIVPIDHGSAFAGLSRRGVTGPEVAGRTELQAALVDHVAFEAAQQAEPEVWAEALVRLQKVTEPAIRAMHRTWPTELDHEPGGESGLRSRLGKFLLERTNHVTDLVEGLQKLMHGGVRS